MCVGKEFGFTALVLHLEIDGNVVLDNLVYNHAIL